MHKEILTKEQLALLPLLKRFFKDFGLVGGTAIALHLGHRRSIDFDFFSLKKFDNLDLQRTIARVAGVEKVFVNKLGEYTILLKDVKVTFFHYPFRIEFEKRLNGFAKMPDLLTLAAMKAYALGMRAKWKDYVDLYCVMSEYYSIDRVVKKAKQIFSSEFNEKIFRAQLAYFDDIDYSEEVIYMKGFRVDDEIIKKALIKFSLEIK